MIKHLIIILLALPFAVKAQTETEIRKYYQEVNKRIEDSKTQGMEGPLYCNEWTTNKHSKSWPAVGIFTETTSFWYDDDPNHLPPADRDPKTVLLKVTVSRRSASLMTSEEYLYKDGRLVFYYSIEGEEGKQWETRLWFNTKGTFKMNVKVDGKDLSAKDLNGEYSDSKPQPLQVKNYGRKYQDLFLKNMVD
jgi:hypothetical protein